MNKPLCSGPQKLACCILLLSALAVLPSRAIAGGTVEAEIVEYPSVVSPGQLVNVKVRIKFSGDNNDGPWQVTDLDLRDDDFGGCGNNASPTNFYDPIKQVDDPFYITQQGVWYAYTFQNVNLSTRDDGGDGIELFVWAEVNDNDIGFNPDGASCNSQVGVRPLKAKTPSPSNNASGQSTSTDPSWADGGGAASYNVYFGTDSTPDSSEYQRNQSGTRYNPGTLAYSTTYYWRINAKNYAETVPGTVWSFTTVSRPKPLKAKNPDPSNGATNEPTSTDPSWEDGGGATSYDVYFGTASSPQFKKNQSGTRYNPGTLAYSTTYYWRINAKNSGGTTPGTKWSFTTKQAPPTKAKNPNPSNGASNQSIVTEPSWENGGGAASYDVYFGTASSPPIKKNQSGTSYNPGTLETGQTYYWRINAKNSTATTPGDVWSFKTSGNAGPGPSTGNKTEQEYGDALYDHWDPVSFLGYNYNHSGIHAGIDSHGVQRTFESTTQNLPEDPNDDPAKGPQEGSFEDNFLNDSGGYYGAYIPSTYGGTMPFADRKKVVSKAKLVVDADITYPGLSLPALEVQPGWTAPVDVSEILSIRCDGLVEYAYEASGIRVWGNTESPEGQWNIALYPSTHNNTPGTTRDPHFELSPWAQRGAAPSTGPVVGNVYSGPPWPDTRMTKASPVSLPTVQLSVIETTTTYADVRVSATDESGIYQITHTKPDGDGPQLYKKNPDRHPTSDTYTPPTIRLVRLPGNDSYNFKAAGQDHGGNWGNLHSFVVPFLPCESSSDCSDDEICTEDACIENECVNSPIDNCCELVEECSGGNICTADACVGNQCVYEPIDPPDCCLSNFQCSDGDVCTDETCSNNQCEYSPIDNCCTDVDECSDGDSCTFDTCSSNNQCEYTPIPDCGGCQSPSDCSDGDICTFDTCSSNNQCEYLHIDNCCTNVEMCSGGNICTTDACVGNQCVYDKIDNCCISSPSECSDDDVCTEDTCNSSNQCSYEPIEGCCASPSTYCLDDDGDGYGDPSMSIQACTAPLYYVSDCSDCNDANEEIHPGAPELCNGGVDDDCNSQTPDPPPAECPVCGDGKLDLATEECDDGNLIDGDGCSAMCVFECDGFVSAIGDNQRLGLDHDIYAFIEAGDETVTLSLSKPAGSSSGAATLVLVDDSSGETLYASKSTNLPITIAEQLPQAGRYLVIVRAHSTRVGTAYRGNYCIELEQNGIASQTLEKTPWVE